EMLKQAQEKLPGIFKWTEYCYSQPAHLFFGDMLLASMAGVQQGDPLGPPLLACATSPSAAHREGVSQLGPQRLVPGRRHHHRGQGRRVQGVRALENRRAKDKAPLE